MRSFFKASAAVFLLSLSAGVHEGQAASILFKASMDNGFTLSNGTTMLPVGSLVRLGSFNLTDSVIAQNQDNVAFLAQNFVEFGNARIGDGVGGAAGYFQKTSSADPNPVGPGHPNGLNLANKQVYLWLFASSDNSSVAQSILTANHIGIFYLPFALDVDWQFPLDPDGVPVSTSLDISDLTTAPGTLNASAEVVVGSETLTAAGGTLNSPNFALHFVPEPSAATAVIASIGLLALRRRRR
ncbi:MAG TPA: PEP-CTERM sorting domain-containing protein, partial [Chthoniobacteraceae bacterium]|nr:PEP-CTERM sorting domain-containing protein [Chthoniobacteraceae bacterium]